MESIKEHLKKMDYWRFVADIELDW